MARARVNEVLFALADADMVDVEPKWNDFWAPPLPVPPLPDLPKVDDHQEQVLRMFSEPHSLPSRWAIGGEKGVRLFPNEICHAQLRVPLPKNTTYFASNFGVKLGYEEVGEAYWEFMTGPMSPYRCLFEHGRPEKLFFKPDEDGNVRQSGFTMNTVDLIDDQKGTLLYNFCIAMRMIHEYPETIKAWFEIQKYDLDPVAALYFGRMFKIKHGHLVDDQRNDGCHWPLWFNGFNYDNPRNTKVINFDRLYEGNPTFVGRSCDQWCDHIKGKKPKDFVNTVNEEKISLGKFSHLTGYNIEAVVSEFKQWFENHRNFMREGVKK